MKKKIHLLTVILLMAGLSSIAQIQKGNFFLNGLNLFSFQGGSVKETYNYSGEDHSSTTTFNAFAIGPALNAAYPTTGLSSMPSINYGLTNKISGGVFISTNLLSTKESTYKSSFSMIFIGPVLRYYFLENKRFAPFAELKAGGGGYKMANGSTDKTSLFGWYLGSGASCFILQKTGLDFTLGYGNFTTKLKDSGTSDKTNSSFVNFSLGMIVGF